MSKIVEVMDGFVKDENGKYHIRPMDLSKYGVITSSSANKSQAKKGSATKKYIHIEPLGPVDEFFRKHGLGSPQINPKRRKLEEKEIRKQLFKQPPKQQPKRFTSYRSKRPSLSRKTADKQMHSAVIPQISLASSPLLDVDEAEKLLSLNRLPIKPLKTALYQISEEENTSVLKNITPTKMSSEDTKTTPTSTESEKADIEFLQLEKALSSAKKSANVSPLSSICTLLENTKIKMSESEASEKNEIISDISILVKDDQHQWMVLKEQFLTYMEEHDKKFNKITQLLEKLEENKENMRRKSLRIASQTVKTKFVVSPATSQKVDLRKSTLNKNLSKTLETGSPRTRKAMNLYNGIRSDCPVLCTPKTERRNVGTDASMTRSLSRRIQNQCLMLQDTPKLR